MYVCLSVHVSKPHILVDRRLLVQKCICNIGIPLHIFFVFEVSMICCPLKEKIFCKFNWKLLITFCKKKPSLQHNCVFSLIWTTGPTHSISQDVPLFGERYASFVLSGQCGPTNVQKSPNLWRRKKDIYILCLPYAGFFLNFLLKK